MALLIVTKRIRSGVRSHLRNLYFTLVHLVICLKSFNVYEQLCVVFVDCPFSFLQRLKSRAQISV